MERETTESGRATTELERFAADALDWPAVREVILTHSLSSIGRRALEALAPRSKPEATLALARAAELQELAGAGVEPPLAGTADPMPALEAAHTYGRALGGEDLVQVAGLLRVGDDVGHWLAGRRAQLTACSALWGGLPDLAALRARLEACLDRRGNIVDDASPALAALRRRMAEHASELDRMLRELAGRPGLRNSLAEGHAGQVHRRGGRRVLAVRQRHAGRVPGIVHDRSQSGETIFVEPREAVELGNALSEAEADAAREEARILAELTREVMRKRDGIELVAERIGELELGAISARYALAVGGRPARLPGAAGSSADDVAREGLVLRGWRHPLLIEEANAGRVDAVVPIDLRLGDEFDMLVVTGPNTGGKTLALKGAGLAALMTRMGLALPCDEGTTVPLFDAIAADIGDEQEIQQNLSTFSSHLVRIRAGLARAGHDTLVLLDELGGGTDPTEGAALGEAILERLLRAGAAVLASTHLGQLKEFAFRHARVENAHVEFDLETLAPRYTFVIGAPGESRALAIARRLDLPSELVDAAEARLDPKRGEADALMESMRGVRVDAERLRAEAEERLVELEGRIAAAERDAEALDERRNALESEAQRGLEERLNRVREWLERARAFLPRLEKSVRGDVEVLLDGMADAIEDASLSDRRRAFLEGLKKGEHVWLPKFKKRVVVTRIHRDKRELGVRLGKHEMRVAFDDVTFYESL